MIVVTLLLALAMFVVGFFLALMTTVYTLRHSPEARADMRAKLDKYESEARFDP